LRRFSARVFDGGNTPTVFISYRRDDTQDVADRLYDTLSTRLGEEHVFMDVDSIEYGVDFEAVLEEKLNACDAMLTLIGPRWLSVTDPAGHRRLDSPEDYVRREIEAGLRRPDVRVIPILIHGASMPAAGDLPESLVPLTRRQACELTRSYFHPGVQRLLEQLRDLPRKDPPQQFGKQSVDIKTDEGAAAGVKMATSDASPAAVETARVDEKEADDRYARLYDDARKQLAATDLQSAVANLGQLVAEQPLYRDAGHLLAAARARLATAETASPQNPWYIDPSLPTFITAFLIIALAPLGALLAWRWTNWGQKVKVLATCIAALIVAIIIMVAATGH